jgi:hypothetical protein
MHKEGDHAYPGIWGGRTNCDVYVAKAKEIPLSYAQREKKK